MESDDDEFTSAPLLTPENPRKRNAKPEGWKKTEQKKQRKDDRNKGCIIACKHAADNKYCQVRSITIPEIYDLHKSFQQINGVYEERQFLQRCIILTSPRRVKIDDDERPRQMRNYTIGCYIQTKSGQVVVSRYAKKCCV